MEPTRIASGTDKDAAYIHLKLAEADKLDADVQSKTEASRQCRIEAGRRFREVNNRLSLEKESPTTPSPGWLAWLRANDFSEATARRWMKLAETTEEQAKAEREQDAERKRTGYASALVRRFGGSTRKYNAIRDANIERVKALPGFSPYITDKAQEKIFCDAWLRAFPESVELERPPLPEKDERKLQRAVDAEIARLKKHYNDEVEKGIAAKLAGRITHLDDIQEKSTAALNRYVMMRDAIKPFMTVDEYRLVLNCLHPDRAPEDRRDRFGEAFGIMKRLDRYFE